ncbi:MAG TPA: 4-hydroxy-tetrahydrodipicolinate synthase [Bacteroidia bacterium]|jgi:4-hydroxy-tetrahydrodipicolinate synthase|nr:4-hydroxy-tetrahydrodipicolinate synthase [Bacteroidia bacterium]
MSPRSTSRKSPFTGTGVAVITPFRNDGKIDYPALTKVIDHIIMGKCEYLVIMGTTGESPALSREEKSEVLEHALHVVNKRVPVVFGIGGNNTAEVVRSITETKLTGVSGILSVSPYYNKPNQNGIYAHYREVAAASKLPVILYNVPGRTSMNVTAETTLRIAHDFPNVVATKEASGNFEQIMTIIKDRPKNFLVISGDDAITLPLIACGADGVISVVANAYPAMFSEMVRQSLAGNFTKGNELAQKLLRITQLFFADGNPGGVKVAMQAMKLCRANVRLPLFEVNENVRKGILAEMKRIK